jgi:hypothetical protein
MTTKIIYSNRKTHIALSLACLYTILLVLNFNTIFWPFGIIDSPIPLAQAILYSPIEYFTSPSKYQFLSYNNFTPWLTLSWDIDYTLFQLEPLGYRVHHLLSTVILLGVAYLLLYRLTYSILNTSIFCLALITLPATIDVIDELMDRHYLEGMILCLLSSLFALAYVRKRAIIWLSLSVLFYGLSILAKEVFIPLPGILFCLFPGNFRRKFVFIIPYAITLLAYLPWRFHMISGTGGYSSANTYLILIEDPQLLFNAAQRLLDSLFVTTPVTLLMLALFALLVVINFKKMSLYTKVGILIGTLGIALPVVALLPLISSGLLPGRWIFAPSVAFLIFFSYLCGITTSRKLSGIVYAIVFACSVGAAYVYIQKPAPFYVKGKGGFYKHILQSDSHSYHYTGKQTTLGQRAQAVWVYVAKLHNGAWGTLPISDVGQLRYHDTENKEFLKISRRKLKPPSVHDPMGANLDLVKNVKYNPQSGLLLFSFADNLEDKHCFVYIFGEHNGILNRTANCKGWSIQYRELKYFLNMMGSSFSDASVAVWSENPAKRYYSRPYKLHELIDPDW